MIFYGQFTSIPISTAPNILVPIPDFHVNCHGRINIHAYHFRTYYRDILYVK